MITFRHDELEHSSRLFRLVRIEQSDKDAVVQCSMQTFAIDHCPPYYALSYTWGPAEERLPSTPQPLESESTPFVLVNGAVLPVTANLLDALERLYLHFGNQSLQCHKPLIWIDAICIDQQNDDERSRQVALMGEIYSNASKVVVWLGRDDSNSMPFVKETLAKLDQLDRCVRETAENEQTDTAILLQAQLDEFLGMFGLMDLDPGQWASLRSLYRRRWFERLWIIQEAALAKDIEVLCGSTTLTWGEIASAAVILKNGLEHRILQADDTRTATYVTFYGSRASRIEAIIRWCSKPDIMPDGLLSLCQLVSGSTDLQPGVVVAVLLGLTDGCLAKEPKDRVYAILGMSQRLTASNGIPIPVSYGETLAALYTRTTRYILESTRWLGVLSFVGPNRKQPYLPSWVPDFTVRAISNVAVEGDHTINVAGNWLDSRNDNALPFSFPGTSFKFTALKIGMVDAVSEALSEYYDHQSDFESGIELLLGTDSIYVSSNQSRVEAFWRLLIMNNLRGISPSVWHQSFLNFWHASFLFRAVLAWNKLKTSVEDYVETIPNVERLAQLDQNSGLADHSMIMESFAKLAKDRSYGINLGNAGSLFANACGQFVEGRRVIRSQEGHLGLGHVTALPGDEIWVSPRSVVPLLLRRSPTETSDYHYYFVGECYLHGIMHGEAFSSAKPMWRDVTLD